MLQGRPVVYASHAAFMVQSLYYAAADPQYER